MGGMPDDQRCVDIIILGAGFGGICAATKLVESGRRNFIVLEKSSSPGGTWRDNTYPGCVCDLPTQLYSFSFAQNPFWKNFYGSQPDILAYLLRLAARHGIERHIRFNTAVTKAFWDGSAGLWRLSTHDGRRFTGRVVIAATGALHLPKMPAIDGLESFAGSVFHTSRWRHDVDLVGRHVGVIGTGASAVQVIPAIAPIVGSLTVFQRSPPWILPRNDRVIPAWYRQALALLPPLKHLVRIVQYWRAESIALGFTVKPKLMGRGQKQSARFLASVVKDRHIRDKLTPMYTMGCKRVLLSDDFYPTFNRDNVELVTEPIVAVRPAGIVTADGRERPLDVMIAATGFKPFDISAGIHIEGRDGRVLAEEWRSGPQAFQGVAIAGYPNLFLVMGPNTALGQNSVLFMIEAQVRYILQCLDWIDGARADGTNLPFPNAASVEVREDVQRAFNDRLHRKFDRSVWKSDGSVWQLPCTSWYVHESGRNHVIWPDFATSYWWAMRTAKRADFSVGPGD
jgi:cation diffusion facilitator CzcD-associated flavoprotein CzcO